MKKKRVLFVIDSLDCAGAEKSLISLLSAFDYEKYSVDLRLFAYGHILEELVPKEVNILKPLEYTEFSKMSFKDACINSIRKFNLNSLISRLTYSLKIRLRKYNHSQKARLFWENISKVIEEDSTIYDIAISYAQGIPTFYVAEKIKANKKFAWVNVSNRLDEVEKNFQQRFYDQFDKIVAVSESTKEIFVETFNKYTAKTEVIYDINNADSIIKMAGIGKSYNDNFEGIRILTIGRLDQNKGYDIALAACKMLKESGINFRWYALGKGILKEEIEEQIRRSGLTKDFILLGVEANPYPFIKDSDIYVQTSRHEGFGLAIAEARMLNIPVVTTNFDAVYNQMVNKKNGLVVDMNAEAVSEGIATLVYDSELRNKIKKFLKNEKKGNLEELEKIYRLIR
ncbi:glycosyltransferase [Peribacillus sp. NJ11]|uniref:glycosyltransferase n=1 Tax=Peribacillus sp. NJ11 TaxID=3055861 RepID=UPI0025A15B53|nr:glycosyltransferase [Peribacillus sp. NJ11]MDM5222793.1 glycosyltransferase [Peribacillus sp. NJ11]